MATRHAARTNYARHLTQLYHHEYRGGFHPSISMVARRQQCGFSSSRSFALPPLENDGGKGPFSGAAPLLDIEAIRAEMLARPEQFTYDTLTPTPSYLLDLTLADYLGGPNKYNKYSDHAKLPKYPWSAPPPTTTSAQGGEDAAATTGDSNNKYTTLKQGYHLIHFPLALPPSRLCPDGTDPYHSPGGPFTRRMWAGGSLEFNHHTEPLQLQPATLAVCAERIQAVALRGTPGQEKLFVDVLRRYDRARPQMRKNAATGRLELVTGGLQVEKFAVREVRTLVFMRDTDTEEGSISSSSNSNDTATTTTTTTTTKLIKFPKEPTYKQTLTPDRTLLFHFSALSYNAHLIHLDERYSQDVEGRPGLLVHGPLCLNLMLEVLRRSHRHTITTEKQHRKPAEHPRKGGQTQNLNGEEGEEEDQQLLVSRIDYRNLAPLYVGDEMTVCVRSPSKKYKQGLKHDVWIENQYGGLCVKGTVITK